jgi:uncharacterized membrane protein YfcA
MDDHRILRAGRLRCLCRLRYFCFWSGVYYRAGAVPFCPLDFVLPSCVLLDVSAAIAMGARVSRHADRREINWMVPLCLLGAVLGVTLLVSLPRRATLAGFGVLLLFYGV